jgi:cytochrome b561
MGTRKVILNLSVPVFILIVFVSCFAMFTPDFYRIETANWRAQSEGQDIIDLFMGAPVLLLASLFASKSQKAFLIWGGSVLYLLYTFVIYCFDVHFNNLFVCYCVILGLLFYSAIYFLVQLIKHPSSTTQFYAVHKITGIFFVSISILFYFLWLGEIIPSITEGVIPASLAEVGLPTNAVHVIDLSVFLPFLFIVGLLLLRKKELGVKLAITALAFCVLMDITIGGLTIYMKQKQVTDNVNVAYIMAGLALLSGILLFFNLRKWSPGK